MNSIIGTKVGMTRIFDESGRDYPVTVISVGPCTVSQVKTEETDGYKSVQLAYGERKVKNMTKPVLGHLDKSGLKFGKVAQPLRFALTGGAPSPGIYDVLQVLGREVSVKRIEQALKKIEG